MQAAALPAIAGLNWVKDGWVLFKRQPLAFFSVALFISLILVLAIQTPPVGPIIFVVLMPATTFMIMSGCRQAAANRRILPLMWFQAFEPPKVLKRLISLGALYLALCMMSGLVSFIPFGAELADALQTASTAGDFEPLITSAQLPLSIFAVLYMLVTMLFWYAPMLVGWHGVPMLQALFFSLVACWRNKLSMLVYGFVWIVIFFAIDTAMSVFSLVGIPDELSIKLQIPVKILVASVLYCSFYPNYVSVFESKSS